MKAQKWEDGEPEDRIHFRFSAYKIFIQYREHLSRLKLNDPGYVDRTECRDGYNHPLNRHHSRISQRQEMVVWRRCARIVLTSPSLCALR